MNRYIANVDSFELETAYEISSECGCANIKWESSNFGEQHIEIAPGGSEDQRFLEYYLENQQSAIEHIIAKNEELEAELDEIEVKNIRRGFIDTTPALLFTVNGQETCEWLENDDHNALTSNDSHLDTIYTVDAVADITSKLEDWLSENPIKIEWSENNGFHGGFIDGGTFDTLAEAEEEMGNFKKELLAQCATDEDRQKIGNGKISIFW